MHPTRPSPPAPSPHWGHLLTAVIVAGTVLRIVQWAAGTSLWLDELYLVESILEAGWRELLTTGLRQEQVAPFGFIGLQKVAVALFGSGERALRLVPLLASLGSLVAMAVLARRILSPAGAAVATAVLAFNPLLVSLAGAVKPYALDVLAVVLIFIAFDRIRRGRSPTSLALGLGVGAVGLFSTPSVVVAGGALGAWILGGAGAHRRTAIAWMAVAGAAALWARKSVPEAVQTFMQDYWTDAGSFMPPLSTFPTWLFDAVREEMIPGLLLRPYVAPASFPQGLLWVATLGLLAAGAIGLFRTARDVDWTWAVALAMPFVGAVLLSRLSLYPLVPRTSVYLLPSVALILGAAVGGGASAVRRAAIRAEPSVGNAVGPRALGTWTAWGATACLLLPLARDLPPYTVHDTRGHLADLAARRAPGEPIFGHPYSETALAYYGPRLGLDAPILIGTSYEPRVALTELDAFRGVPGVWVVFTFPTVRGNARDPMLCYLAAIGVETDRALFPGASIHRFDLSDPERLVNARADDFVIDTSNRSFGAPECRTPTEESGS
ncbi:MAG: hypothetical protein HKO98_06995 [Gemmatimonadetes bacterium]|nr:hypothetical protein [Gemmatimonadota bacterium]